MKKYLKALCVSALVSLINTQEVLAREYHFNQHIGFMWVSTAEVYKNNIGGVTAIAYVNMPTCGSRSRLAGHVVFSYKASDGGYFQNYKFPVAGYEGYNGVRAFVNVPYDMSDNGLLTLTDGTYCSEI